MDNRSIFKIILPTLILIGIAVAGEKETETKNVPMTPDRKEKEVANRKTYDALYSEILNTLPQGGKVKVDSALSRDPKANGKKEAKLVSPEDAQKIVTEKHNREMEELSPAVKARVDKVLSNLDNRRKEKTLEFKELDK